MRIGEYVRKYREEHFMSQRDFAKKCGLSNAQISLLERGIGTSGEPFVPSFVTVAKVAQGMGMTTDALFAVCDDFAMNISDQKTEPQVIESFVNELQKQSPDEAMLIQAYRLIPEEHRIEAMQAVLSVKMKYEN